MDVDYCLKQARAAIAAKNYDTAIEYCQSVLSTKKNSYMALILMGAALVDKNEAETVFEQAIALKDTNVLAYRGLAKFYERRQKKEENAKLRDVYYRIISLDTDNCEAVCDSLYNLVLKTSDFTKCANVLYEAADKEASPDRKLTISKTLVKVLNDVERPNADILPVYKKTVDLVSNTHMAHNVCMNYLKVLYAIKGCEVVFDFGMSIYDQRKSDILAKTICDAFNESYALGMMPTIDLDKLKSIVDTAEPFQSSTYITKSIISIIECDYFAAYENCMQINANTNLPILPLILVRICIALGRYLEAENIITKYKAPNIYAECKESLTLIALGLQNDPEQCRKAIAIAKSGLKLTEDYYRALFNAYVVLKQFTDAENILTQLKESPHYESLKYSLMLLTGREEEALEGLKNNPDDPLSCIELGRFYLNAGDYKSAVGLLLTAASRSKFNYNVYALLGECFMLQDDPERAKKCFRKTLEINPECSKVGKLLSNIYVKSKEWGSNYELLKMLMNSVFQFNPEPFQWIWFQLGLHHIGLEQWDDAIANWRIYIRLNPEDSDAWEMLADAYYNRGSYTSALKCFHKVVDMNPQKINCFVHIGTIQCMLGLLTEAQITFERINIDGFLPALKGLAEVKLQMAREKFSDNLFGLCRDCAQESVDLISLCIAQHPTLSCLWKILFESVMIVSELPPKHRRVDFDPDFNGSSRDYFGDLYPVAVQIIDKAINAVEDDKLHFYHDLATIYYRYFLQTRKLYYAKKAYVIINDCIERESKNWQHWNLLGILCSIKEIKKHRLAQHAFFKALELDPTNCTLWNNLGVFYLITGHIRMAYKSFVKAQESNPTFLHGWIGQSLISEMVKPEDTMGLFRHATSLGFHKESTLGYAYSVVNQLNEADKTLSTYSIEHMHAIPKACHLMSIYVQYDEEDACAWNVYGVLLEKLNFPDKAQNAFNKSLHYVKSENKNPILLNLGRSYYKIQAYSKAIDTLKTMTEFDCTTVCLLAECYMKNDQIKDAYVTLSKALQFTATSDEDRAEILLAMSDIMVKYGDKEFAETLLFQCIALQTPTYTIPAILSMCITNLLTSDPAAFWLNISELEHMKSKQIPVYIIVTLKTYALYKFQGRKIAVRYLINCLRVVGNDPKLWELLSRLHVQIDMNIVNISSKKAFYFGDPVDRMSSLKLACLSEYSVGNHRTSKILAQKAIMANPGSGENWSLLFNVLNRDNEAKEVKSWLKNLGQIIVTNLKVSTGMMNWINAAINEITLG